MISCWLPIIFCFFAVSINPLMSLGGQDTARDQEQWRLLEVRRYQLALQAARRQYERSTKLAAKGLLSQNDVEHDINAVATAQLNYQQAVLALLDLQPRISVREAIKTQTSDGRKFVRLVITNLTPTFDDSQFKLLNNFEGADPIPEQLLTRTVRDIFVSLRDSGGIEGAAPNASNPANATISLPYEVHIPEIKYGETQVLNYQILRDVDAIVVSLTYRNQTYDTLVQLQHSNAGRAIQVSSSQFSQEVDLGSQTTYNLTLERPTVDVRSFQLKVVNLPRQVAHSFIDLQSQARLSQINFPAGVTKQTLGLRISLPERADTQVQIDKPLEFWALALDEAISEQYEQGRIYSDADLRSVGVSKVRLVLMPRGIGKIDLVAPTLFSETEVGHTVESNITVRNTGTQRLDNINLSAEYPLNWRVEFQPNTISYLDLNSEERVKLKILPPPDVGVGDYEVRIKTESFLDNRRVQSEDKIYRVSVKARANILGTSAIAGGLLLLIGGIVAFAIKMTKR